MAVKTVNMKVDNSDELRDSLHHTGIFEMTDCIVEITCNMNHPVKEVQKMLDLIKGTINVVDTAVIMDQDADEYLVQVREVEAPFNQLARKRATRRDRD